MTVVADSSPLVALVNIGHIQVLAELFGKVLVPPAVACELRSEARPDVVRRFMAAPPDWLEEQHPAAMENIPHLHAGEVAAISLAIGTHADILLIDDLDGRRAALSRGLRVTGTVGVLEQAARRRLLDLGEAFERLKATDFWISHRLLDERLRLFRRS